MSSLARLLILSALLLGLFLAAVLAAQGWLHRQSESLRSEAIAARRAQLLKAIELLHPGTPAWTRPSLDQLGSLIDAEISPPSPVQSPASVPVGIISFTETLPGSEGLPGIQARITFTTPPLMRIQLLHARTWALLLVLALGVMLLFVTVSTLWLRPTMSTAENRPPWLATRGEMGSLEQLAKVSVAQRSALADERDARLRTEQDLLLNQRLLNQSLEEKIRFGRDLHDGLIQSLYAAGLTLESIRPLLQSNPEEADRRLGQCLEQLNTTIHEVRDHITGLAPERLSRVSFDAALMLIIEELRADRTVDYQPTIDAEAAVVLSSDRTMEILQIAREAISNSLRHGHATCISVRLHRSGSEVGLLVQDNGLGFDPASHPEGGFGIGNMRARAAQLGAALRIDSRPGEGTRMVLTIPV